MLDYREILTNFEGMKAWVYVVMFHNVEIGSWDGRNIKLHDNDFDWENVLELRVFNKDKELRYIRVSDELKCRLIEEDDPNDEYNTDRKSVV